MYGATKWNIDFAGILTANEDMTATTGIKRIIVNRNGDLQFYVRIISVPPANFPSDVKDICFFTDELTKWGFTDNTSLSDDERKAELFKFLDKFILVFNVEHKRGRSIDEDFYTAKNISIHKKSDEFKEGMNLQPVPIFSEKSTNRTQEMFEHQLSARKMVGDNKQVSKEEDDTPTMILWRNEDETQFTVYGAFKNHETAYGGFRFHPYDDRVKALSLPTDVLLDSYIKDDLLFVTREMYADLERMLEAEGQTLYIEEEQTAAIREVAATATVEVESVTYPNSTNSTQAPLDKETEFMLAFEAKCQQMGLYYDKKDLYNFHTAMKTGGIVILAGMSGTGKSKLVQCYANALKLNPDNLLFVPVSPSWQEDSDVIGYVDKLQNVYRAGDSGLIDVLRHANTHSSDMHIVCFDEMNLARVEHYFSQFLSVLELEENKRVLQLYSEDHNTKPYNFDQYPPSLRIGSNVIFVGTVNLDESTYHFSDKVLDRANVITLTMQSYADVLRMEDERLEQVEKDKENANEVAYSFDVYKTFKSKERRISLTEEESSLLWKLHNALQESNNNLGVGWRIVRQISSFLNNIPSSSPLSHEEAFDVQIVQRILTKVRGSEEQYQELIGRYDMENKEVKDSAILNILDAMPENYTFEKSKKVIMDKAKELRLNGFTV
ncbi:AAA family ATPase [Priestia megaterium]|nr:AAA family ATPase [Priestia megaterium]